MYICFIEVCHLYPGAEPGNSLGGPLCKKKKKNPWGPFVKIHKISLIYKGFYEIFGGPWSPPVPPGSAVYLSF